MNALLRRRGMMLANGTGGGFLYPLVAGTRGFNFTITTSENGHVVMYNGYRQTGGKYANLRDVATYYTSAIIEQMSCPIWFKLEAGQECVFEVLNRPSNVVISLYEANSTTKYKTLNSSTNPMTFTVESDVEIGSVGLETLTATAAGTRNEFDISLVVDGRRYF